MTENKTKANDASVDKFLAGIAQSQRRADCMAITSLMKDITGSEAKMWGDSIVGFGDYHYKYASGREGDWFLCGFSPRKQYLSIYIMGYLESFTEILSDLGKFKHGKGCIYINNLEDIDQSVLRKLIETSIKRLDKPN